METESTFVVSREWGVLLMVTGFLCGVTNVANLTAVMVAQLCHCMTGH
jgi:hypothetical protein